MNKYYVIIMYSLFSTMISITLTTEPSQPVKTIRNIRSKRSISNKNINLIPTNTKQKSTLIDIEATPQEINPSTPKKLSRTSSQLSLQNNTIPLTQNRQNQSLEFTEKKVPSKKQSSDRHTITLSQPTILKALESKSHKTTVNETTFHEEIVDKFVSYVNKTIFSLIKKSFYLSADNKILHITFAEIVAESLKDALLEMSHISERLPTTRQNDSMHNFNMQIQYLAEQIKKYNAITIYTSPDDMLLLIQFIHQFLKENNVIFISSAMFIKLNTVLATAQSCCHAIKNADMIFSSSNAPKMVLSYFRPVIDSTNNLPNIKFSRDLMHAIYDSNGYTDQILQTWQSFQRSDLYKTPANRQYGAFLTFLLIFETSMIAAAIILNETSALYKITNPVPVVIDIA